MGRDSAGGRQSVGEKFARTVAPPELFDKAKRKEWRLEAGVKRRGPYVVELNLQHAEGLPGAINALFQIYKLVLESAPKPILISKTYARCELSLSELRSLLKADNRNSEQAVNSRGSGRVDLMRYRALYKVWPDFPVTSQVFRSLPTIKANAAQRSFEAEGHGIVWAVIDSGIDGEHPHFGSNGTLVADEVRDLHRSFLRDQQKGPGGTTRPALSDLDGRDLPGEERAELIALHRKHALKDEFGHGTHVAGILAGQAPSTGGCALSILERVDTVSEDGGTLPGSAKMASPPSATRIHGVAPYCRLVSLKVLDDRGQGRSSDVIRALEYIRESLNDNPKLLRVHGVNLSVGYEFDAEMFACGQSPLCAEVNRLVQSGVVVVAAAGNTGYGTIAASARPTKVGLSNTINDPGNADMAITVGATHRDAPYLYGVSYFSSKGPTGDGRLKPDLVAPGERIVSCGAGARLSAALNAARLSAGKAGAFAHYIEDSGTSMAAPHVSGAIAAFLSIRREFIGRPLEVKRIFLDSASPLGRERYFEGHGLVDLVRAIQSV
jgi:subtilisin family serine protease